MSEGVQKFCAERKALASAFRMINQTVASDGVRCLSWSFVFV